MSANKNKDTEQEPGSCGFIPIDGNGFWMNRSSPVKSLNITAELFDRIGLENIIEVGSGLHGEKSGNSVLVWAEKTHAKKIIAIDLDQELIDGVIAATSDYPNVEAIVTDGIQYLREYSSVVGLLYLDFWTPDPEGTIPGTGRAEAYREAYQAARDKMGTHSLILIDDTDHIHPWKHTYIIPDARKDGYSVAFVGRQTLLVR